MSMKKSTATAEIEPVAEARLGAAAMDVVTGANGMTRGGEARSGSAASGAAEGGAADRGAAEAADVVTLELTDLLTDSNGEIVLFNDSHLPALALRVDAPPIDAGELGSHITAAGDDVSGYRYLAFTDGTKLIFQDTVDLVLLGGNGDLHV